MVIKLKHTQLIKDPEALYFASGMVDAARDALQPSAAVHGPYTGYNFDGYFELRCEVRDTLTDEGVALMTRMGISNFEVPINVINGSAPTGVTYSYMYRVFASLAHFCDLVHQAPQFRVQEKANAAAVKAMEEKLSSFSPAELAEEFEDEMKSLEAPLSSDKELVKIGFA